MVDLNKECEVFFYELSGRGYEFENKTWIHGLGDVGGLFDDDQLNMAWEMYLAGQESKQAEIESLKAQQKLNKPARIGGTVFREGVTWETVIECAQRHYDFGQRDTQPTPLISLSDAIKLASGELVLVPKDPTFQMKQAAYKQYDTGLISITEIYQAMIEAAQGDGDE